MLDISLSQAKILLNAGQLQKVKSNTRRIMVTRDSVNKIIEIRSDPKLIDLEKAATNLNQSKHMFKIYWIDSGFIPHTDIVIGKYILKQDFQKIKRFKQRYITSNEAGELSKTHRTVLNNLEKGGRISPKHTFTSRNQSIKYFDRKEVVEIICKQ